MRLNICSCLLAFVLGCKLTAAIIHQIVEEKTSVTLPCPHAVDRKVTWSREKDGRKVDILTIDGDRDIRHDRRYNTVGGKSLYINRVTVSDSGRYFCNEAAVELTVIPSGTIRRDAPERTSVTLKCPHDDGGSQVPTWSRNNGEIRQRGRFYVSPVDKTLTIRDVQPDDSGLYYCDGKPAVCLNVIEDDKKTTTSTTPTSTAAAANTEIIHKIIKERDSITLPCPHSGARKVTWSRKRDGQKVDILIIDGDRDIRLVDKPQKRYSSLADNSLYIFKATVSDAAKFFCNNEPAAELTVIPSGTLHSSARKRTSIILPCPADVRGPGAPTWTTYTVRDGNTAVQKKGKGKQINNQRLFFPSPVDQTLTITNVQPEHSGLYYCNGKPAAYLNVNE